MGAVAWHASDGLAAGVSRLVCISTLILDNLAEFACNDSGGLLLKYPGRVGEVSN